MRVLLIANSLSCYGANNSLLDMTKALKKRNVDIIVLIPGYGEITRALRNYGIEYYIIPYKLSASATNTIFEKYNNIINNIFLLSKVKKIVIKRKIDLIHTNASNVNFGALLSIVCGIPHIWHIRENVEMIYNLKYDFPKLEILLKNRAACLISISHYIKDTVMRGKGIVIYNGFDLDKYVIDKQNLFSNKMVNILVCGEIQKEKGVMDAIKALQELVKRGYTNYILHILGKKSEYCMDLIQYVNRHNLRNFVIFHGHQMNMKEFRKKADIALQCSSVEALGRVTIESMLGECFVIGANAGATSELIRDGKTGYLYSAGNAVELADKIVSIYANKEESTKIVRKAKKFAIEYFDAEKYADKIIKIYEKCLEEKNKKYKL